MTQIYSLTSCTLKTFSDGKTWHGSLFEDQIRIGSQRHCQAGFKNPLDQSGTEIKTIASTNHWRLLLRFPRLLWAFGAHYCFKVLQGCFEYMEVLDCTRPATCVLNFFVSSKQHSCAQNSTERVGKIVYSVS